MPLATPGWGGRSAALRVALTTTTRTPDPIDQQPGNGSAICFLSEREKHTQATHKAFAKLFARVALFLCRPPVSRNEMKRIPFWPPFLADDSLSHAPRKSRKSTHAAGVTENNKRLDITRYLKNLFTSSSWLYTVNPPFSGADLSAPSTPTSLSLACASAKTYLSTTANILSQKPAHPSHPSSHAPSVIPETFDLLVSLQACCLQSPNTRLLNRCDQQPQTGAAACPLPSHVHHKTASLSSLCVLIGPGQERIHPRIWIPGTCGSPANEPATFSSSFFMNGTRVGLYQGPISSAYLFRAPSELGPVRTWIPPHLPACLSQHNDVHNFGRTKSHNHTRH